IGGYFDGHPWHQKINVIVEDTTHPATRHLGGSFQITDEIYQFRTPYSRSKLHILMRMDTEAVDRTVGSLNGKAAAAGDTLEVTVRDGKPSAKLNGQSVEVKNLLAEGPRGKRRDRDNALAWTHEYGKGRVFYTALGHRDELWRDERFLQ